MYVCMYVCVIIYANFQRNADALQKWKTYRDVSWRILHSNSATKGFRVKPWWSHGEAMVKPWESEVQLALRMSSTRPSAWRACHVVRLRSPSRKTCGLCNLCISNDFEWFRNDFYDVSMHFWLQELAILAMLFPSFSSLIVKQYFGRCTLIWSMSDRAFQSPSSALPCLCDSALCLYPQIPHPTWLKMIGSLPQQNMNSGPLEGWGWKKVTQSRSIDSYRF